MARMNYSAAAFAVVICISVVSGDFSGEPEWTTRALEFLRKSILVNCEQASTNFLADGLFGLLLQCFVQCKGQLAKFDYKHDGALCTTSRKETGACHSGVCKKLPSPSAILSVPTGRPKKDLRPFIPSRDQRTTDVEKTKKIPTEATSMPTGRTKTLAPATHWLTTAPSTFDNQPHDSLYTRLQSDDSASSVAQQTTRSVLTSPRSVLSDAKTAPQMTKPESKSPQFVAQTAGSVVASDKATSSESVPATFYVNPSRAAPTADALLTPEAVAAITPWPYIIITDFAYKFAPPARLRHGLSAPFSGEVP